MSGQALKGWRGSSGKGGEGGFQGSKGEHPATGRLTMALGMAGRGMKGWRVGTFSRSLVE